MIVGTLTVEIHLGAVFSLKEKRQVVRSVVDRIRQRFNVSVAEVARQEDHRWAVLDRLCGQCHQPCGSAIRPYSGFLEKDGRFAVVNIQKEIPRPILLMLSVWL